MATALTSIFGSEINVYCQPRQSERQYVGFPGAHGVVSTHLGTRGRQLVISGTLRATGANYAVARAALQSAIDTIESYLLAYPADYSFAGAVFSHTVFDKFQLVPDGKGKVFGLTGAGWVTCNYIMYARTLL